MFLLALIFYPVFVDVVCFMFFIHLTKWCQHERFLFMLCCFTQILLILFVGCFLFISINYVNMRGFFSFLCFVAWFFYPVFVDIVCLMFFIHQTKWCQHQRFLFMVCCLDLLPRICWYCLLDVFYSSQ